MLTLPRPLALGLPALALAALLAGCDEDLPTNPIDEIELGQTALVFGVNPLVNDASEESLPEPGSSREGVEVELQDGPSATTGAAGLVVLAPVRSGTRTVAFDDGEDDAGDLTLDVADRELREVAVALSADGAASMVDVRYAFGGEVVEITSDMTVEEVNDVLSRSNVIALVRGGTYSGDVDFSGSGVTLFGEGPQGGNVTLDGNVTVSGSGNRLRGARITGDLVVDGSGAGVSFSSVAGSVTVDGSDATLLYNAFCGAVEVSGSGAAALGNAGMAPIPAPSEGC